MRALAKGRELAVTVHACTVTAVRLQTSFQACEVASMEPLMLSCVHSSLVLMPRETWLAQMLETFSGLAIGQMVAERATLVMRMSELEDWDIVAASHKTGQRNSANTCLPFWEHVLR